MPDLRVVDAHGLPGAELEIVALLAGGWSGPPPSAARVASVVGTTGRVTHLARRGEETVGFVDGFITTGPAGDLRWEVDLVAVAPHHRGAGIGSSLVAASSRAGAVRGASLARAVVARGNVASERCFARESYAAGPDWLHLWSRTAAGPPADAGCHVVTVTTLTYDGWWLEGGSVTGAADLMPGSGALGMLVPEADLARAQAAAAAGFADRGVYRAWTRRLTP